jgi:hypothetical protein
VPRERHPHTSPEVMTSVLLPQGFEPVAEPTGGICYCDPDDPATGEVSLRRFLSGIAHAPSPQVAAELHLHSGDGSRRWTSDDEPTTVDGAEAMARTFVDAEANRTGAVVTAQLGETLLSARAIWMSDDKARGEELLSTIREVRLLALEDLAIRRRSQLHPVLSISVEPPDGWRITQMDETVWEFTFTGGTCTLREADLSGTDPAAVRAMLTDLAPRGATLGEITTRPSATRSPTYACEWQAGSATGNSQVGVVAVLLREIPILIEAHCADLKLVDSVFELVDSLRTHPALY